MKKLIEVKKFLGDDITIISHEDLDGIGAVYILSKYLRNVNMMEIFTSMNPSDKETDRMVSESQFGGKLFICDRSVSQEQLEKYSKMYQEVIVIDHHDTNKGLDNERMDNVGLWFNYDPSESATLVALNYCNRFATIDSDDIILVDMISKWDTWNWKGDENEDDIVKLSKFSKTVSDEELYVTLMNGDIVDNGVITDIVIAGANKYDRLAHEAILKYCSAMHNIKGKTYDIIYSDIILDAGHFSDIASNVLNNKTNTVLVLQGNGFISFRKSQDVKLHLGLDVASKLKNMFNLSGGGHDGAAGISELGNTTQSDIIKILMEL